MRHAYVIGLAALLAIFIVSWPVVAQIGNGYDLTWNTIDNGGGTIGNSDYTLDGTIGQPDAGAPISNGGYTLTGGFWADVSIAQYRLYLPVVLRS